MRKINPTKYAQTRNFGTGTVTKLGPYLSRGVISTKMVWEHLNSLKLPWNEMEKLTQELAWRDYWQHVWRNKGDAIYNDLKQPQVHVSHNQIPLAMVNGTTGVEVIDQGIRILYQTGYMHNHLRMYVAAISCNVAQSHWRMSADWLYYHLLDGDVASNYLSWQWVAGSFSNKKYYANQENINYFFKSTQKGTFLDVTYPEFEHLAIPQSLAPTTTFSQRTKLPQSKIPPPLRNQKTYLYNYYNLDPFWHQNETAQRILLLEPSKFEQHPVSDKCIKFTLGLAQNIPNIRIYVGEFESLLQTLDVQHIHYKEHPLNHNYLGNQEPRDWLGSVSGDFKSFFAFWKKCKPTLRT